VTLATSAKVFAEFQTVAVCAALETPHALAIRIRKRARIPIRELKSQLDPVCNTPLKKQGARTAYQLASLARLASKNFFELM
jgi:hypothetical protein